MGWLLEGVGMAWSERIYQRNVPVDAHITGAHIPLTDVSVAPFTPILEPASLVVGARRCHPPHVPFPLRCFFLLGLARIEE